MSGDETVVQQPIDPLLDLMITNNVPITRENYLKLMFFDDPPPWSAEYEHEIPAFLQDWENKSFGVRKMDAPKPSNLGRKGFHSLTLEELEELGEVT